MKRRPQLPVRPDADLALGKAFADYVLEVDLREQVRRSRGRPALRAAFVLLARKRGL